ncbi:uncharacterized protein LOC120277554 [Dioscorea cayenensis subsp. rotundata]|uniref:Uncharacterized protein LOC120277554 n=1 Tax=Dioscorea cayennensis subsp. rotundata TaxID=55577 RepID=A0AB40CLV4_DIOCR|nr:uncharacterized protein LOC120277554 [Dioscorea cayenensis subsp. rotundata]
MASSGRIVKCAAILILSLIIMLGGGVAARDLYGSTLYDYSYSKHNGIVLRRAEERFDKNISFKMPITERLSPRFPPFDPHNFRRKGIVLRGAEERFDKNISFIMPITARLSPRFHPLGIVLRRAEERFNKNISFIMPITEQLSPRFRPLGPQYFRRKGFVSTGVWKHFDKNIRLRIPIIE